ncbi:hypothetical protein GQ600_22281 [Phytophthora cactorum]|nr:hypothetical protein GQ600_22281 [Phytophthora cactorum]
MEKGVFDTLTVIEPGAGSPTRYSVGKMHYTRPMCYSKG